jgi:hypothetical protein
VRQGPLNASDRAIMPIACRMGNFSPRILTFLSAWPTSGWPIIRQMRWYIERKRLRQVNAAVLDDAKKPCHI